MHDPYLYDDVDVLKNKLGIKEQKLLEDAEADYVVFRLKELALKPLKGEYDLEHLLEMHRYTFQDIYEWAGKARIISIYKEEGILGGQSVEYTDPFDIATDIHHVLSDMKSKEWSSMEICNVALEFCDSLARLWKIHPFREGNTRITVTFMCQYMEELGFPIDRELFEENSRYVRTALVAYNAYFADGSDFSKKEYLEKIVKDAFGVE